MAILVTARNLTKSFGSRPLFDGVSFMLAEGERVGLIGPNGAGKTTLLRILAGEDSPDAGEIAPRRGLRVGHLAQVPTFAAGRTVRETVLEAVAHVTDPGLHEGLVRRADEIISRLDLTGPQAGTDTLVEQLSGGWRKRVALARELVREPELLLLDEPTNHLDVESILWLEKMLAGARFTTLTITHDRLFLQRISNRILELDRRNPGGLLSIDGDYATFVERKADLMAAQEHRESTLRNTLRRETEWLRRGPPARSTKQRARIQRADSLADEVGELTQRNAVRTASIDFSGTGKNPRRLIEARGISKSYGDRQIFGQLDVFVGPGSRIGLIGANGCGKSTLLRVLVGEEPPDQGTILRADGLEIAFFQQHREALDPALSVVDTLCPGGDHVTFRGARVHVSGYLSRFLFRAEHHNLAVRQLSGGEQSRLALARLMLRPANVLVLDEPTNDLDLATLDVLEDSLIGFDGAVLLVTHDRYFLDRVTTHLLAFGIAPGEEGQITTLAGLAQWESWHVEQMARIGETARAKASGGVANPSIAGVSVPRRKLSYKDQRDFDTIEARIAETESRLAALKAEQERPEVVVDATRLVELEREVSATQAEVDALYQRWSELEALIPGG
jgi:ATP-binding cassette subfamily F protein uup